MQILKLNKENQNEYKKMYKNYIKELQNFNPEIPDATNDDALNRAGFDSNIFLFKRNNDIVGFAILGKGLTNSFSGHDIYIEEFYVKEKFRKKGLGRNMVKTITELYPSMDFSAFILENNSPALSFWESTFNSLGYSERTSVGKIYATSDKTIFKYWAMFLPF